MNKQAVMEELRPRTQDEISIVMSCDDNYAPYLATTLQSIIENAKSENAYTVYILTEELSKDVERNLLKMATEKVHVVRVDMLFYMSQYPEDLFYTHLNISKATYYRFFIPLIFKHFKKVIYCDCDAIFMADPAELYQLDMTGKLLGAVTDPAIIFDILTGENYYADVLKLRDPLHYFQAGFLVFCIPQLLEYNFTEKCLETLKRLMPRLMDQDVMNVVCEGQVYFLEMSWNVLGDVVYWRNNFEKIVPLSIARSYKQAFENPKFMHFAGRGKPWNDLDMLYANIWWHYARKTPLYEQLFMRFLYTFQKDVKACKKVRRDYIRCSVLSRLTWGERKQHYLNKSRRLKQYLDDKEFFLK